VRSRFILIVGIPPVTAIKQPRELTMRKSASKPGAGPTVMVAIEHTSPASNAHHRRSGYSFLPLGARALVLGDAACASPNWMFLSTELGLSRLWSGSNVRKRYIDDSLIAAARENRRVVNLVCRF